MIARVSEWNRATYCNNKPIWENKRKDNDRTEYKKSNLKSKIFKSKSKDRDSNFLVIFSSSEAFMKVNIQYFHK